MRKPVGCVVAMLLCLCAVRRVDGAVEGFEESFDGEGRYSTISQELTGLDNPNWDYTGEEPGSFDGDGYVFEHRSFPPNGFKWARNVPGNGSFRQSVKFSQLDMGWWIEDPFREPGTGFATVSLTGMRSYSYLSLLYDPARPQEDKVLDWGFSTDRGATNEVVPLSPSVEIGIEQDFERKVVWAWIDSPTTGRIVKGPITFTPYEDNPSFNDVRSGGSANGGASYVSGRLNHWSLEPLPDIRADINDDGVLNTADVTLMSLIIRRNGTDAVADLSIDGKVDQTDLGLWIHDHRKSYFGDANLDGQFSSTDLVQVYQAGKFETGQPAGWAEGDWDPNGVFDSSDLVAAFHDGGYETGPRPAVVPEPSGQTLTMIGWIFVSCFGLNRSCLSRRFHLPCILSCLLFMYSTSRIGAANDSFVETFNGSGIYATTSGQLPGLDNPGWSITSGEFRDEGLAFSVVPGTDRVISSTFSRKLSDSCSFKERIELRNYYQSPVDIFGSPPSNYSEVELAECVNDFETTVVC